MEDVPKIGIRPVHPGEILREDVVPALGRTKTDIARMLGISRQTLHDLLAERQPVTAKMALRIGKLCGNGPDLWFNLQRDFDMEMARREVADEIAKIPTLAAA